MYKPALAGLWLLATLLALPHSADAAANCGTTAINLSFDDIIYEVFHDNGPGKIGPRRLVVDQVGTMVSIGTRTFRQGTPMDINQATVRLKKTGGKGKTEITICSVAENGTKQVLHNWTIPKGSGNIGQVWNKTVSGIKHKRLTVHLAGKSFFHSMDFELELIRPTSGTPWTPTPYSYTQPVTGFADLHNHQAAYLAYAKGWYWGSHESGPPSLLLSACTGDNHGAVQVAGIPVYGVHTGATQGYPTFAHWPAWHDISHQQVAEDWLEDAHDYGLNLLVASVVHNEWLCAAVVATGNYDNSFLCNDMESVKRQILSLKDFDDANSWYTIVRDPWEARTAIQNGQLAVVLAVEVSNLLPTSDGDYIRQLQDLYDMGVRSVQLAHETNSRYAGAAYHRDIFNVMSQIKAWFDPTISYASSGSGTHNAIGMTVDGQILVDEMVRLGMLLDISHMSLEAQRDIHDQVSTYHQYYPLFNSHTRIDALLTAADATVLKEFVTTDETLEYVRETGGLLGLRTGDNPMLSYTPMSGPAIANNCDGSTRSFAQFYQYADDRNVGLGFGSDFNGFITQIAPRFGPDACASADPAQQASQAAAQIQKLPAGAPGYYLDYRTDGLSHNGLLPGVVYDLDLIGVDTSNIESSAEAFLQMWERVYDPFRDRVP